MATYRKDGFKFDRANLRGVDSDCIKGLNAYLVQREREINTFTTSVITYQDGPFAGQGIELCDQSPGMLPLDFKGWTGFYTAGGKWTGTTGEPLAIVECGALAARKDAEFGKGFSALGDLFAELGEDPAERAFTVTTDKPVSIPQNGQDDFGNALDSPRRAGTWCIAKECTGFIPSKSRARGGRETWRAVIHSHADSAASSLFMDDFGDLINAPGLLPDARVMVTLPKMMAVYTIGRTSYKINATPERIDALRALILSKKRYFSDKLIQRARPVQSPEEIARDIEQAEWIEARARQSVAQVVASATAAAAIEQASEATEPDHQDETADAGELATVDAEPCAMAAPCDASSASSTGSAATHGHASSSAHQAPAPAQRATHDANGQRIGQHVAGHSGNWCAVMFRDDCGRPAFEFEGPDGSREVWSFETGRERMAALQAMAREADDAADQSNDASDADQPPAEQASIESIKDAIRINEREMERVLKSKRKGSKESAYRIELIISGLTDKLSAAMKAQKSTTTPVEYQQPAPVPKTKTEADTKAADKVPRAVVLDSGQQSTSGTDTADEVPRAVTQGTRDNTAQAAPTVSELVALLQARGFHGVESRRRPGAVLLARRGNDYPLTYSNTTQAQRCIAKLAAAGVAASVRGPLVVVTGAMQPPAGAARTVRDIMPTDGEHISDPAGRWEAWITGTEPRACVLFYRADAFRPTYHYSYKTTDKAREALRRFADEAEAIATERDNRKAERRAKLDQPHGLAVGDVLRSSWGYDQTNTDYFEVTRVIGKRTVEVRQLAEQIEQTAWAQGNSVPVPGQYVGAPMRRQVDTQGAVNILHATYGRAYKMEPVATVAGVRCFSPSGWSSYA